MSTIAGSPEANGFLNNPDCTSTAHLVLQPMRSGNVYIADTANCLVRKITFIGHHHRRWCRAGRPRCGRLRKCARLRLRYGRLRRGWQGGTGGTKLGAVNSVAVDSHGNVFFSDKTNSVIWEVPAVTAGNARCRQCLHRSRHPRPALVRWRGGPANPAQISGPTGIFIDIYNNLFIADAGNHRIREVPAINVTTPTAMTAGSIYTIAGNGTSGSTGNGGAATSAEIATPFALVVDHAENVYFSDTTNQTVRKVNASTGNISTVAGTNGIAGFAGDGAAATSAQLNVPQGLALLPDATPEHHFGPSHQRLEEQPRS